MKHKLKAAEIERLENTSIASIGMQAGMHRSADSTPLDPTWCCVGTACSVGAICCTGFTCAIATNA